MHIPSVQEQQDIQAHPDLRHAPIGLVAGIAPAARTLIPQEFQMEIVVHRVAMLVLCLLLTFNAVAKIVGNTDGTATDATTGLMWKRCAEGQTMLFDASSAFSGCSGTGALHLWDSAMAIGAMDSTAGYADWRLPNIRELQTIVDRSASPKSIDLTVFPGTAFAFWSATERAGDARYADFVNFDNGTASWLGKSGQLPTYPGFQVRLVRTFAPPAPLDPTRPNADYVDTGNGTVTHQPTGLMWKRCAEGLAWTGATCTGIVDSFLWDAAMIVAAADATAGYTDWRLPSAEDLLSLSDYVVASGASINQFWFPNTPGPFWSASVDTQSAGKAWFVNFLGGGFVPTPGFQGVTSADFLKGTRAYAVRLVRGGTAPPATPVLQGAVSRRVHGAAGTFDLALSLVTPPNINHNPTTEPRQGSAQTIVFTFDKPPSGATVSIDEGTATAAAPTFSDNNIVVNLAGVTDQQYVTIALTNVTSVDGGAGGSGSVRVGFLAGDVNQNRVVTVADLGLVNAQLAQPITAAKFLNDVNASGTTTVADMGITNANLTRSLPAP
jgi:hypothetical protein